MPPDWELVHGIDVVDVDRFRRWLEDPLAGLGDRFTANELKHADDANRSEHLAGFFAAKEACLKALGLGAGDGVPWTDIEVAHSPNGVPRLRLNGRAEAERIGARVGRLVLSLSHSGDLALASVVGVRRLKEETS